MDGSTRKAAALIALALGVGVLASPAGAASGAVSGSAVATVASGPVSPSASPRLSVREVSLASTMVRGPGGTRGAAAGTLPDGRLLLGGGRDGRRLYLFDPRSGSLRSFGAVIRADQRYNDQRFAPTDIEVMSASRTRASIVMSYPEYVPSRGCVRVAFDVLTLGLSTPRVERRMRVFTSWPCVAPNRIQHASGRIVRVSSQTVYVTVGDLGFPGIANRSRRGSLGSVWSLSMGRGPVRISQGHRNGQGLLIDSRGRLWETEHGPYGGDELNLIRSGRDYGWPFVTYGRPYTGNDYVMPTRTGTHVGYEKPRTYWVPSVATSEIVQVPRTWRGWQSASGADLLMGTLKDKSMWRIRVSTSGNVLARQRIPVGHRIRDVEVLPSGVVFATTDDGRGLLIRSA